MASVKLIVGDPLLLTNRDSNIFVNSGFAVQRFVDASRAVHAEMVYHDNGDGTVVTLGSDFSGLMFRERPVDEYCKIIRMSGFSSLGEDQRMLIMESFHKEKGEQFGRGYPFINTVISGANRTLDAMTFGIWKRLDFGMFNGSADCSATVAELLSIMWPGFLVYRREDRDLLPPRMVTPGDLDNCPRLKVVKDWG